jgi:tripartite-type tricarboxylate transporter receptor subunit TctC
MSDRRDFRVSRREVIGGLAAGAAAATLPASLARAQQFPARPITLIVPYGAGGTTDLYFRGLQKLATKHFPQPIVIENKPGVGGAMGAVIVAKTTKADGYTISQAPEGILRVPHMEDVPYNVETDFTYIMGLAAYNFGIAVRKDSPIKSFAEFMELGKKRPGEITYSAGLANTTMPLMLAQAEQKYGSKFMHVPFRSGTEMMNAVLGKHVDVILDSSGGMAGQIDSGEVRLLATFGDQRSLRWSDAPTAKESGFDMIAMMYFGLIAGKGLDPEPLRVLHDGFKKAIDDPEHQTLLKQMDMLPWYKTSDEFRTFAIQTFKDYGDILAKAGFKKT